MTYQEAIDVIKWGLNNLEGRQFIVDGYGTVDVSAKTKAFGMAIEALEKQIPKKPKKVDKFFCLAQCQCGSYSIMDSVGNRRKYCSDCGARIDWSDVE